MKLLNDTLFLLGIVAGGIAGALVYWWEVIRKREREDAEALPPHTRFLMSLSGVAAGVVLLIICLAVTR